MGKDSLKIYILSEAAEIQIESERKELYCFNDDTVVVRGVNIRGNIGSFSISPPGTGLIDLGNNLAYLLPNVIQSGMRTVTYTVDVDGNIKNVQRNFNFNFIDADFTWDNECFEGHSIVNFTDLSVSDRDITGHQWNIYLPDDTVTQDTPQAIYTFSSRNTYPVELIASTHYVSSSMDTTHCYDTVKKDLILKPTFAIDGNPYLEDFQDGQSLWYSFPELKDGQNSWTFGTPTGDIFHAGSSEHAWYTQIANLNVQENSYVESPCFDFSDSQRPMIKMDMWRGFISASSDLDGAVLQYTIDNGVLWNKVGSIVGDGINWYNSYDIEGHPGGEIIGWTNSQDTNWIEVRHKLDALKGKTKVRFRIAYGAPGGYGQLNRDGIAFDNIWIGERSKKVLIEHFTNAGDPACVPVDLSFNTLLNDPKNVKDIIDVQYHLGHPGPDPFYDLNPDPPNSRELYYGIPSVPYGFIDGGRDNQPGYIINYSTVELEQNDLTVAALDDNIFNIDLQTIKGNNLLDIHVKVTALQNMSKRYLTLHTIVIENKVTGVTGENGETSFESVVKAMLPDVWGTVYNKSWTAGESMQTDPDLTYVYENVFDEQELRVVAFVQDETTKTIYQAEIINPNLITDIQPDGTDHKAKFTLFPNPASSVAYIKVLIPITDDLRLELLNAEGRVIYNREVKRDEKLIPIELNSFDAGLYFVRLISSKEILGTQGLIHTGNK